MALVQLDKWTFDTVGEKILLQIGDLSNISSVLTQAKALSPTSKITGLNVSYISVSGDDVCSYGSDSAEYTLLENEYIKFTYGKTTNSSGGVLYGAALKDKLQNTNPVDSGWGGSGWGSGKLRIGVILDTSEQRGYLLWNYYSSNSGWGLWISGGTTNGTDIYWETFKSAIVPTYTSNGGGATHIAKVTGQLKDLSSNLSDILLVSGGGGGGLLVGEDAYAGEDAGGIAGSGNNSANQTTGYAFGQGESADDVSCGGGGLYGGYKGSSSISGGAGSGYIGNSLLSNKKMVGYNVPTSEAESTKTESVDVYSASGESNKPKAGNGKAKIAFLRDHQYELKDIAKTINTDYMQVYVNSEWWNSYESAFSQYLGTNNILQAVQNGNSRISVYDGTNIETSNKTSTAKYRIMIPVNRILLTKITVTGYTTSSGQDRDGYVELYKIENGGLVAVGYVQLPTQDATNHTVEYTLVTPSNVDYLSLQGNVGQLYITKVFFN